MGTHISITGIVAEQIRVQTGALDLFVWASAGPIWAYAGHREHERGMSPNFGFLDSWSFQSWYFWILGFVELWDFGFLELWNLGSFWKFGQFHLICSWEVPKSKNTNFQIYTNQKIQSSKLSKNQCSKVPNIPKSKVSKLYIIACSPTLEQHIHLSGF